MQNNNLQNVIIIRKNKDDGVEPHGGAWKIALADMMTAMMAFFLVMWLISATDEVTLKGIADHFKPPEATPREQIAGTDGLFGGLSILDPEGMPFQQTSADTDQLGRGSNDDVKDSQVYENISTTGETHSEQDIIDIARLADEKLFKTVQGKIVDMISKDPLLEPTLKQVEFIREKDGLRIQIVDSENSSMFDLGTNILRPNAANLIDKIVSVLKVVPNKLIIRGHTDSRPFINSQFENNWTLSADRAEATRLYLQNSGIDKKKFVKIEGVADAEPYVPDDLMDPRNRRINIILKYQD